MSPALAIDFENVYAARTENPLLKVARHLHLQRVVVGSAERRERLVDAGELRIRAQRLQDRSR